MQPVVIGAIITAFAAIIAALITKSSKTSSGVNKQSGSVNTIEKMNSVKVGGNLHIGDEINKREDYKR